MNKFLDTHFTPGQRDRLQSKILPSVAFSLQPESASRSRLGGDPLLPANFEWPAYTAKPVYPDGQASRNQELDFLLQIDLSEIAAAGVPHLGLPSEGLLTFFYDLENQPWGFDPDVTMGSRVILLQDVGLRRVQRHPTDYTLAPSGLRFFSAETLPHVGSRAWDSIRSDFGTLEDYDNLAEEFERSYYPPDSGRHRLLGHSANKQGDMQLEAQLVTGGLYCGDTSAYVDPRRALLEPGAEDWVLLLQLDSDDSTSMMWGDMGMLYFWIRKDDLAQRRFHRTWMTLQCC